MGERIQLIRNIDGMARKAQNAVPVNDWDAYFSPPLNTKGKLARIVAKALKPVDNRLIANAVDSKYQGVQAYELLRRETLSPNYETIYDFFQYLLLHLEVTYHGAQMIHRFSGGRRARVGLFGIGQNHIEAEIVNELVQPDDLVLADISLTGLRTLAKRLPSADGLSGKAEIVRMDLSGYWPTDLQGFDLVNMGTVLNWTTKGEGERAIQNVAGSMVKGGLFFSTVLTDEWTDKVVSDHVGSEMQRNPGRTIAAALTAKEWAANTYLSHNVHRPNLNRYLEHVLPSNGFKVLGMDTDIYWPMNGNPVAAIVAAEKV